MASRRVRIKGIANIPQRKKPHEQQHKTNEAVLGPTDTEITSVPIPKELHAYDRGRDVSHDLNLKQDDKSLIASVECKNILYDDKLINDYSDHPPIEDSNLNSTTFKTELQSLSNFVESKKIIFNAVSVITIVKTEPISKPKVPIPRRFIKPKLSFNAIKKNVRTNETIKPVSDEIPNTQINIESDEKQNKQIVDNNNEINKFISDKNIDGNEIADVAKIKIINDLNVNKIIDNYKDSVVNNNLIKRPSFTKPTISHKAFNRTNIKKLDDKLFNENNSRENEVNFDEINLPQDNADCILNSTPDLTLLPKLNFVDTTRPGSDTEYSPIISSPSKFANRARIKAVPRLGQRRTSFSIGSASESEDDTRRSYRVRNDSVSSSATVNNEIVDTQFAVKNEPKKEFNMVIQRKCKRTDQSRKLAEARRDFKRKFNNGKPDRQRLTMMDLIFYNPMTAPPMSQKKKREDSESIPIPIENPPEDNPDPETGDEENVIPAPQIKIGPNGEITIDEKSLVVESENLKKNREALKNTGVIDGDFDTNYGVYKRKKRSKDWNKQETLLFYKALNTMGTDFTLMSELFPHRNRKELKMKFKKEERINRTLIDRAVMQPIHFDLTALRREVEVEKMQKEELDKIIKEKREKSEVKRKRRRGAMGAYVTTSETSVEMKPFVTRFTPIKHRIAKLKPKPNILHAGIKSIIRKSATNSETSDSDDNKPLIKRFKTRSGRISKPAETNIGKIPLETKEYEHIKEKINIKQGDEIIPGSLMILTEAGEDGKPIYNIYTIDNNGKKIKIDLTDEILKNLTQDDVLDCEKNETEEPPTEISIGVNLTELNNSDMIVNGDSMIIPFEEFDSEIMLENEKTME